MRKDVLYGSTLLLVIGFLAAGATGILPQPQDNFQAASSQGETVQQDNTVRIYKNGELVAEKKNALMEGEAIIRNQSTTSGAANYEWDYIALGDGNNPTDTSTSLDAEISSNNLSAIEATLDKIGSGADDVEWNYTATFVADGSDSVSTTALKSPNAPSSIDYYAGTGFGRTLNVVDGDKITVEWNIDPD